MLHSIAFSDSVCFCVRACMCVFIFTQMTTGRKPTTQTTVTASSTKSSQGACSLTSPVKCASKCVCSVYSNKQHYTGNHSSLTRDCIKNLKPERAKPCLVDYCTFLECISTVLYYALLAMSWRNSISKMTHLTCHSPSWIRTL